MPGLTSSHSDHATYAEAYDCPRETTAEYIQAGTMTRPRPSENYLPSVN